MNLLLHSEFRTCNSKLHFHSHGKVCDIWRYFYRAPRVVMERFNNSPDAKVFFGSIKACGEGISLVSASRVIILDVHFNPSVSRQAIGRAFKPGQLKKVYVYRLVAADSPKEEDHAICYNKELISKRWFEWKDHDEGSHHFQLEEVDLKDPGNVFLDSSA